MSPTSLNTIEKLKLEILKHSHDINNELKK